MGSRTAHAYLMSAISILKVPLYWGKVAKFCNQKRTVVGTYLGLLLTIQDVKMKGPSFWIRRHVGGRPMLLAVQLNSVGSGEMNSLDG